MSALGLGELPVLAAPMAGMRIAFSRMPRKARPNGELIKRRATRKQTNSTATETAAGRSEWG